MCQERKARSDPGGVSEESDGSTEPSTVLETFHWEDCAETLAREARGHELMLDDRRRAFEAEGLRLTPPLVFPIAPDCRSLEEYLAALPLEPARHVLILMQAGATSLGLFEAGEAVSTKTLKRYVVRGKGRAQPTHLNAKGKSRYGSRLRLQNAKRLLEETNEKLLAWWEEYGAFEGVYYNAPVRLWPTLFQVKPKPPFERDEALVRVPLDLPRPTTDVLLRTYRSLCYGRVERSVNELSDG